MLQKSLRLLVLLCAGTLLAQSDAPSNNQAPQTPQARRGAEPCWQQAGIDKSVMEQVWSITKDTHSQIESVCSNTSLTPQQKHQQVREIREKATAKRESLLTADQRTSLTACQARTRRRNHSGGGEGHEEMRFGCDEIPRNGRPGAPNQGPGNGSGTPPPSSQSSPQN